MVRKTHTMTRSVALIWMLVCLSLGIALYANGRICYAQEGASDSFAPLRIAPAETVCTYRYFDYPTAIAATADGFAVADGKTVYNFGYARDTASVHETGSRALPAEATKIAEQGDTLYALVDDTLHFISDADAADEPSPLPAAIADVRDFAVAGDTLAILLGSGNALQVYDLTSGTSATISLDKTVKKIAARADRLYLTCASRYDRYYDDVLVMSYAEGWQAPHTALAHLPEILGIDAAASGDIAVYTRNSVETYTQTGGVTQKLSLRRRLACADVVGIAAAGDAVYGLGDEKSVFRIDASFAARAELLASAHDELGFYRSNAGIASSTSGIAVADERNGRIQILTDKGIRTVDGLVSPKAVAFDDLGNLYAAHGGNRIDAFTAAGAPLREVAVLSQDTQILDLKLDADDTPYILAQDGRVLTATGETVAEDTSAIAVSPKDNLVYRVSYDGGVYRLGETTPIFAVDFPVLSLCIDHVNAFYLLTDNGKIKKYAGGAYTDQITPEFDSVYPTYIAMNTYAADTFGTQNNPVTGESRGIRYGDLLLSDSGAHALLALFSDAGFYVNEGFDTDEPSPPPSRPDEPLSPIADQPILYRVTQACTLYEQPAKIHPIAELKRDFAVIVPYDEENDAFGYDEKSEFTYVLADNMSGNDVLTGYVRTKYLSACAYTSQHPAACHTLSEKVDVYKYPTRNLEPFTHLPNSGVTLCDFATHTNAQEYTLYGYADNFADGYVWYRVRYDNAEHERCEGYVRSEFILGGENPDLRNSYPRTNAKIVSKSKKNKNLGAVLYEKNAKGEIVPVEDSFYENLPVGKKVEVRGSFDTSEKYTHIYFYHEKMGTVTWMYVETANLEYEGVNKVHVIAAVVIVLTLVLGAVLFARYCHIKRRQKDIAKI